VCSPVVKHCCEYFILGLVTDLAVHTSLSVFHNGRRKPVNANPIQIKRKSFKIICKQKWFIVLKLLFILNRMWAVQRQGIVPFALKFVVSLQNYVAAVRRGPTAPESAKLPTGKSPNRDNVTRTGAAATSTEKRTLTGKLFQFPTKDWA